MRDISSINKEMPAGSTWGVQHATPEDSDLTLVVLGEQEGNVTPNLAEGSIFTITAKGNLTIKKPTNWPAGASEATLVITENAEGAKTITLEGVTWLGGELVPNTAANAINAIQLVSWDSGTHWYAWGALEGKQGAIGPTGPEAVGTGRLLRPKKTVVFKTPGEGTTEQRETLAESLSRRHVNSSLLLTSGTPLCVAIETPAKTLFRGLAFYVATTEGTPANRTHLWVALLNSKLEVLRRSLDYTSSAFTSFGSGGTPKGLKFTETYESGEATEVLYGVVCEVMSSTNPLTVGVLNATSALNEFEPRIAFLGEVGRTEPASLTATVIPSANTQSVAYMALI